eukprot:GHRR01001775.1.p1 GENE.GHRR01001775.1~~GHRR01001775.1.p1  ORF type:complete len:134 (+),score=23.06 GHRR01001775.1:544-945(+)
MCWCWRPKSHPPLDDLAPGMEFRFVQEPYLSEINNYIRQRQEHIKFFTTTQDVRAELLRTVAPGITPADMYPKAHQLVKDDDYLLILRDMFNLSSVLDDMEHTGTVPYHIRGHYYNVYSRLYRMLLQKAKQVQ